MFLRCSSLRRFGRPANLQRSNLFNELKPPDIARFQEICGAANVFTAANNDDLTKYNQDWLGIVKGESKCVIRPGSTRQVSKILKHCNAQKLAVTPQGGNTGLVGGSVPVFDEVVLSMEKMNKTIKIDEKAGVAVFEAGKILEQANAELNEKELLFPLDLGAKGSCQLGGNLATNAGGLRLLRYGNLHGSCLGLEFVKADGTIVDVLSRNKKDNTGIDLKQLLIGSEGTLGVITKAAFQCPVLPNDVNVLLCCARSYNDCVELFKKAREQLGEILSAFEFFDSRCVKVTSENLKLKPPEFFPATSLEDPQEDKNFFAVLVETSGGNGEHDQEKLESFLESSSDLITDGSVAASKQQQKDFWAMRERIAEALVHDGYTYKYDVSVPNLSDIYKIVGACEERLVEGGVFAARTATSSSTEGRDGNNDNHDQATRIVGYGHMGDGNLHLNVTSRKFSPKIQDLLEPWLWTEVQKYNGSISAEHGIGLMKVNAIQYSKNASAINLMRSLKKTMDPNGILNPYKVFAEI